uniref:Uncharacterized protein n=1 Tax=Chromera velia CCMP2878 TaxID=1169474 RepID=A0A0G4FKN5_9ALVE|eukprot:Cvel_17489.t1-p1 / transcript=Cvel_17489.t1 / gene=Cvel_17489 / organism=Chromera_velia_CCMP2878 / gene_product=hypothetical protein / transcript_product=hypothetical protein / location=Cvel_scaffold1400:11277-12020(-) / protein_length=185 / sequence_SO=supercontig / SO=protein_coding / is_pseudo=false
MLLAILVSQLAQTGVVTGTIAYAALTFIWKAGWISMEATRSRGRAGRTVSYEEAIPHKQILKGVTSTGTPVFKTISSTAGAYPGAPASDPHKKERGWKQERVRRPRWGRQMAGGACPYNGGTTACLEAQGGGDAEQTATAAPEVHPQQMRTIKRVIHQRRGGPGRFLTAFVFLSLFLSQVQQAGL